MAPILTTGAGGYPAIGGGGGGFSGEGNLSLSVTALSWYGLAAYSAATAGTQCANVRRGGDNATQIINTLANGNFDASSFTTFVTGGDGHGYVDTLYDQVSTRHVSQATLGAQPEIILNVYNGSTRPTMRATTQRTLLSSASVPAGPYSVTSAAVQSSAGGNGVLGNVISDNFTGGGYGFSTGGTTTIYNGSFHNGGTVSTTGLHSLIYTTGAGTTKIVADGSSSSLADVTGNWTGGIGVFDSQPATWYLLGDICKVGLYSGVMAGADLTSVRGLDQTYWGTP